MAQYESLETVTTVRLAIDYIEYLLLQFITLTVARSPVVARTATVFGQIYVLWIIQLQNQWIRYISNSYSDSEPQLKLISKCLGSIVQLIAPLPRPMQWLTQSTQNSVTSSIIHKSASLLGIWFAETFNERSLTFAYGDVIMLWMTRGSKSNSTERGI